LALDHFSIDDVRDSFAADMAAKIRRVYEAGQALLASPSLTVPAAIDPAEGIPGFEAVNHACHAIFGTSALVSARSLAESARLIEILSDVGKDATDEIERRARIGRSLGEACIEGAQALARMLDLELAHRGREAWDVALEFRERMARWQEARDLIADGAPPREFAFEDDDAAGSSAPTAPAAAVTAPAALPVPLEEFLSNATGPANAPMEPMPIAEAAEFSFEDDGAPRSSAPTPPAPDVAPPAVPPMPLDEFSFDTTGSANAPLEAMATAEAAAFAFEEDEAPTGPVSGTLGEELLEVFTQEAREGLVPLEHQLRRLSRDPRDREAISALERIYHTLKGSAATVGLSRVSAMAADLQETLQDVLERGTDEASGLAAEDVADLVTRTNSLLVGAGLPSVSVSPATETSETREEAHGPSPVETGATSGQGPGPTTAAAMGTGAQREPVSITADAVVWEAFEEETAELLASVERLVLSLEESQQPQAVLLELFRSCHTLKGSINTVGLAPLGRVIHRVEDFLEELAGAAILPPLKHVATLLLNVQDDLRRGLRQAKDGFVETRLADIEAEIQSVRGGGTRPSEGRSPGDSSRRDLAAGSGSGGGPASSGIGLHAPGSSGAPRRRFTDRLETADRRSVRVTSERLDGLMNLTGELVVGRSRLLRRVARLRGMQRQLALGHQRLTTAVERFREKNEFAVAVPHGEARAGSAWGGFGELEMDRYGDVNILARNLGAIADDVATVQAQVQEVMNQFAEDAASFGIIVSGLQSEITRARMVPVDELFARLRLPVRDVAHREGKSVRVTTSGEDVDLDKTIVDKLYVPLLHIVRNAVSHGVERPEARRAAGKDPVGTIAFSARHESGLIVIEVADDGGGLDLEALRAAAVRHGALGADTPLDSPAVADAVFLPGLSTRRGADDVAGRGVGGDVVRREIEKLGGDIRVHTVRERGTTFRITLPLTLAITRALLIRHGGQVFAVPLAFIERLVDLEETPVMESAGRRRVKLEDGYQPLHSLDAVLGRAESADGSGHGVAVLLRAGEKRLVVSVDRLLGHEEIVVKSLGELLSGHPLLTGVTLSGDGELILILDVPGLLDPQGARPAGPQAAAAERASGPARVLFVDDSLSVRKVAEKLLRELGAEVTLAVDGQDALDTLARQTFDVVFTDLEMPRLHGYELIQAIAAAPQLRHVPVVVVTSRSGQKHRDEAHALGARDYLTKPFNQQVLGQMLRKWAPGRGRR
jgi:chemosensory pili system protein ChpA (sensor histidine kinase/response regulator)